MVEWIIRSKLEPPVRLRSLLERDALANHLESVLNGRVAILHAPAGYGKTSLLACWRQSLLARGIPVAWLSLDDHDQDHFQFLSYLVEACKAGSLIPETKLSSVSGRLAGSPPNAIVGAILTELGKCSGPQVIVLDDFHRAETRDNCRVTQQLFTTLPANIHFVISTREYPSALALADLRAQDELIEIDQSDLQFSEKEIRSYLGPLLESAEDDDWPRQLHARTEGWPIAMQAVRRWVAEGAPLQETLDQLSGRSADLSDYFLEQVFENLAEDEQSFLLRTSILERVTGELANLLCGIQDGWEKLEDFGRRDLFVTSLDRERAWYRYQRLFSEFLQERLRRRFDGQITELHRLASAWFYQQGFTTEAVQHALKSQQAQVIASLFEHLGGWQYAMQGHVGVLERALSLIDDQALEHYPRLFLGKVFLTVRRGDMEDAETLFGSFVEKLAQSQGVEAQLQNELVIIRGLLNAYADHPVSDDEIEKLELLSESLPQEYGTLHAVRYNLLCAMYAQRGSFDACMTAGDKAIPYFRAMGSVWGETFIYFHEGYACMAQGRLRDAEALYGAGYDLALENFGSDSDLAAIGSAFLAELAYERNNTPQAQRLLDTALPHIERFDAWLEVYVAAYTTALKLSVMASDQEKRNELISRAKYIAVNRRMPRLQAIVEMQAAEMEQREQIDRHGASSGDRAGRRMDLTIDHPVLHQLSVSVGARWLQQQGETEQAVELLRRECRLCRQAGLMRSFISLSVLLSTVLWTQGEHEAAVGAFEAALAPSLFEGNKRRFIDEGNALLQVIRDLARTSEKTRGNRLRDRFLAELMMEINAAGAQPQTEPDALSPRELEVMRYLFQGFSNQEIAQAIPISVNTVKFHLKNIFEKLGVSTRKDAVSTSIRRGFF